MENHENWLVAYNQHAVSTDKKMLAPLAAYQRYLASEILIKDPETMAKYEGLSLQEFKEGLEEAKKQGWLGQVIYLGQAILITLTIPEGLSADVGLSD